MAPAAVLVTIPQYAATNNKLTSNETHLRESSEWNNMGDSALDFDLLAEYLLEDMGAGGFDFGASAEAVSPPIIDTLKTQPTSVLPDPGIVTPNPNQDGPAFIDPLTDVTTQLQQPLPTGGDLAGELSQVQQMIAATQQQQQQATDAGIVAAPQPPLAQPPAQPQTQMAVTPMMTQQQQPVEPVMMGMRHASPQQQPKLAPAAPIMAAAPVSVATAPITQQQRAPPMKVPPMTQPPNKRPRFSAASVASVNRTNALRVSAGPGGAPLPLSPPQNGIPGVGGRQNKSQAQIDRRRERNRILARRTRLRKKFFFESLQKDVADLQRENAALKSIVRSRLKPDDARALLSRCNANGRLPSAIQHDADGVPIGAVGGIDGAGVNKLDKEDFSLIQSIQNSQQCFIITDPSLHDNPIVYASDDFLTLTGYSQEEVLGRNCRFLQGTETCQEKVSRVRKAVQAGEDVNVTFANYTSDGTPFWNSLFIAALRDADNNIVNFIGVIVKVVGPEPGDSEYGKVLK
mmetsp:Transcript_5115/g.10013  ORF Transcript_5115/g.10013 Transcript_5115/m.10013 type:complete len:516 (-) Transcript_5115:448-1995(-)